jgi:chromosome segregation ATPase
LEAECGHAETQISQLNERLEELRLDNKETLSRFEQAIEEKSVQSGRVLALSDQIGGYKAEIQELQTELLEYKAKSESNKPRAE